MADRTVTIKRYNGSSWDTHYPKTTIAQVINLSTELADLQTGINNRLLNTSSAVITALGYTPARVQGRVVNDMNHADFRVSGMYGINGAPTNGYGEAYGALIVANNLDTGLQIAGGFSNDDLYFRGWSDGGSAYTTWRKVWHAGNLTNLNQLTNGPGYITGITSAMIETALGSLPAKQSDLLNYVPIGRKINGKTLGADIFLIASDVGALASGGTAVNSSKLNGQSASYYQTASNAWNKTNLTFSVSGTTLTITST